MHSGNGSSARLEVSITASSKPRDGSGFGSDTSSGSCRSSSSDAAEVTMGKKAYHSS